MLVRFFICRHLLHGTTHICRCFKFSIWQGSLFWYKKQDTVKVSFILSKLRLSPANSKTSIPKLELQAAVMATHLKVYLFKEIKENMTKVFLWTDSKTVLNYLRNEDRNFGVFVAHKVKEIHNHTTFDD